METGYTPHFSDKSEKYKSFSLIIEKSILDKMAAEIEAMPIEEKLAEHYAPFQPEIPNTKKGIEEAIDIFIADFDPTKDNAEELIEYLEDKPVYEKLQAAISKESTTAEICATVKGLLMELPTNELNDLYVFGIKVTEAEAKDNVRFRLLRVTDAFAIVLHYAIGKFNSIFTETETTPIEHTVNKFYTSIKQYSPEIYTEEKEAEDLAYITEMADGFIKKYPKETEAFCKCWEMAYNNFSEVSIIKMAEKILA